MKNFFFGLLILLIAWNCQKNEKFESTANKSINLWQKFELIKDTLNVDIPIEGKLLAWRKIDLISPTFARVISLMVEKNSHVKKGDLLLHLWPLKNNYGYTPLELFSPMDGIVAELYISLNDTIKQSELLLTLENRKNLTLRAKINSWQASFIKRNANVTLFHDTLKIKGAVLEVDKKDYWITVVVPNEQLKLEEDFFVNGLVHLKNVTGDFLPANIWNGQDSLLAEIDEETSLNIFKVGLVGDSLVLISPSFPDVKEIQIKKNLDFNK